MEGLKAGLEARCGRAGLELAGVVVEVSRIPYGRPPNRTPEDVLAEWRGTCSTKHVLLAAIVDEAWPQVPVRLWHRPYRVTQSLAAARWGAAVAAVVPEDGLVDIHTYGTLRPRGRWRRVDVTFPLDGWDGRSDLELACGPGRDHAAGADPMATKAALVAAHCDPAAREPFIAALAGDGPE